MENTEQQGKSPYAFYGSGDARRQRRGAEGANGAGTIQRRADDGEDMPLHKGGMPSRLLRMVCTEQGERATHWRVRPYGMRPRAERNKIQPKPVVHPARSHARRRQAPKTRPPPPCYPLFYENKQATFEQSKREMMISFSISPAVHTTHK